jgi:hypothetical protein
LLLAVVAGLSLLGPPARAADPAAAESLFRKGKELMKEGKLEEACRTFEASMKAESSGGTLLNLALCHEKRGMTATAWAEYKRAIPMFRDAGEGKREQAARDLAAKLEPRLSKLTIVVEEAVDGLSVTRDGKPVDAAYFGTAVAIDPGAYEIEATAPGHAPWSTEVTVGLDGDKQTVNVPALQPAGEGTPAADDSDPAGGSAGEGTSPLLVAGVIVGGIGLVATVIGGVMGGMVLSDAGNAEDDPALCPGQVCTPEGREAIDAAEGKALVANILIPVGAAAAVGGLIMILVGASGTDEPAADAAALQLVPAAGPHGGSLELRASF